MNFYLVILFVVSHSSWSSHALSYIGHSFRICRTCPTVNLAAGKGIFKRIELTCAIRQASFADSVARETVK